MAMEYEWAGDVVVGGQWMAAHRERMGLSQRDVDRRTGISAQNVSAIENGLIAKPAFPMLAAIGTLYGVTPNQIAEAYGWWREPGRQRSDPRMVYLESVLKRLPETHRDSLLEQVEASAMLAERKYGAE